MKKQQVNKYQYTIDLILKDIDSNRYLLEDAELTQSENGIDLYKEAINELQSVVITLNELQKEIPVIKNIQKLRERVMARKEKQKLIDVYDTDSIQLERINIEGEDFVIVPEYLIKQTTLGYGIC